MSRMVTHLFTSPSRRDAFIDGVEWVNDSALRLVATDLDRAVYQDVDGDGEDEVIEHFEPTCDLCDERQNEDPDWNGETGNHLSCEKEARHAAV